MKFQDLLKPLRKSQPSAPVCQPQTRPYGVREERTLSDIADREVKAVQFALLKGPVSWSPENSNLAGIVLCASEQEVRVMLAQRVIARLAGRAEVKGDLGCGRAVQFVSPEMPPVSPESDLMKARMAAVIAMEADIDAVVSTAVRIVVEELKTSDRVLLNVGDFSAMRRLPWPLEGWDGPSMSYAEEMFVRKTIDQLGTLGHSAQHAGSALMINKEPDEPVPPCSA